MSAKKWSLLCDSKNSATWRKKQCHWKTSGRKISRQEKLRNRRYIKNADEKLHESRRRNQEGMTIKANTVVTVIG